MKHIKRHRNRHCQFYIKTIPWNLTKYTERRRSKTNMSKIKRVYNRKFIKVLSERERLAKVIEMDMHCAHVQLQLFGTKEYGRFSLCGYYIILLKPSLSINRGVSRTTIFLVFTHMTYLMSANSTLQKVTDFYLS